MWVLCVNCIRDENIFESNKFYFLINILRDEWKNNWKSKHILESRYYF